MRKGVSTKLLATLFFMLMSINIYANDEKKYITQSKLSINAFQCSIYNLGLGNGDEAHRLFKVGYSNGIEFINFANENSPSNEGIPYIYVNTYGPTADFILGRIYQKISHDIYDENYSDINIFDPNRESLAKKNIRKNIVEHTCNKF